MAQSMHTQPTTTSGQYVFQLSKKQSWPQKVLLLGIREEAFEGLFPNKHVELDTGK